LNSNNKPHIYFISEDFNLIEQFTRYRDEYRISFDDDGRHLKRIKHSGSKHNIDLVVVGFDLFTRKVKLEFSPKECLHLPVFVVISDKSQAETLCKEEQPVKFVPVFLPIDFVHVKSTVDALIQNREKAISFDEKGFYKHLYRKAPVVQFLVDPFTFRITEANRAAAHLFGKSNECEFAGQHLEILFPENSAFIREKLIESGRFGESNFTCNIQIPGNGSMDFAVFVSKIAIRNRFLLFMNFSDITYSKNAERILTLKNIELQKTNAELDNFVYSTSHELRAPLMSVLGLINLIEAESCQIEKGVYVGLMKESIKKLDKIIHDIVDYARNARSEISNMPIEFASVMENIGSNTNSMSALKKVELRSHINQSLPFHSDARRVEIVLRNLISNSIKFFNELAEYPYVEVMIEVERRFANIRVQDNGRGIPESHLPRIFEMFFRGDEQSAGSGIGLYIVKEIIEKLNGSIHVESTLGKGTIFNILLPNQFREA